MSFYIELGGVLLAAAFLYMLFQFLKNPVYILTNSVVGLAVFLLLNGVYSLGIAINLWSILIVGFGGIAGLLMVLVLHYLGIAF